jgi:DNA polymerase (family 10)
MAHSPAIMTHFVNMPQVARILGNGDTKSSIELHNGLQADLRILVKEKWGTALNYFSGSKEHNVRMRQLALAKGLSLNEHAFSPVDADGNIIEDAPKIFCDTEEAVYAQVGLPFIHPELREDAGEIEAAQKGTLPKLITLNDIKGDLHMHSTYSDGTASIQQMAEEAYARGREYIVITDHSRSLGIANGLSIERLLAQQAEIRQVDALMNGKIRVFSGTEMACEPAPRTRSNHPTLAECHPKSACGYDRTSHSTVYPRQRTCGCRYGCRVCICQRTWYGIGD